MTRPRLIVLHGGLSPEYSNQCARQLVGGLMDGGGEVLIHHGLRLGPVADSEPLAQGLDVGQVFFGPTSHELAGQDIPQVAWDIQAHGWKLILTQLKEERRTIIVEEQLALAPEPMTLPDPLDNA